MNKKLLAALITHIAGSTLAQETKRLKEVSATATCDAADLFRHEPNLALIQRVEPVNEQTVNLCKAFVEHRPQLERAAFKILVNAERAQDVVQDTYLKMIEAAGAFEVRQLVAYLFQMVRNLAIDAHRRAALEARLFAGEELGMDVPDRSGTPESITVNRQDLRIVSDALTELPERTQCAFKLHRLDGLTQREIADKLGVSITLVNFMIRDTLNHCTAALRKA